MYEKASLLGIYSKCDGLPGDDLCIVFLSWGNVCEYQWVG